MRIIAGRLRGLHLSAAPGTQTRPTQDRVREALFSILGARTQQARVLDLFAGAGMLGVEALSRGAFEAVFVESGRQPLMVLRQNIEITKEPLCLILPIPVDRALTQLGKNGKTFDLIFMDPPYGLGLVPRTLEGLVKHRLVAPGGCVVTEHETRFKSPREVGNLMRTDQRRYGDTTLSIYAPLDLEE